MLDVYRGTPQPFCPSGRHEVLTTVPSALIVYSLWLSVIIGFCAGNGLFRFYSLIALSLSLHLLLP